MHSESAALGPHCTASASHLGWSAGLLRAAGEFGAVRAGEAPPLSCTASPARAGQLIEHVSRTRRAHLSRAQSGQLAALGPQTAPQVPAEGGPRTGRRPPNRRRVGRRCVSRGRRAECAMEMEPAAEKAMLGTDTSLRSPSALSPQSSGLGRASDGRWWAAVAPARLQLGRQTTGGATSEAGRLQLAAKSPPTRRSWASPQGL